MAYGANGKRNGLHAEGKHQHGWWCLDSDWIALCSISKELGVGTVTGLLHGIACGTISVGHSTTGADETLADHGVNRVNEKVRM